MYLYRNTWINLLILGNWMDLNLFRREKVWVILENSVLYLGNINNIQYFYESEMDFNRDISEKYFLEIWRPRLI